MKVLIPIPWKFAPMALQNVEDIYPLTPAQEGMLFHSVSAPNSGIYVEQVYFFSEEQLKVDTFHQTWKDMVAKHDLLRTAILWEGLDEPLQVVRQEVELAFEYQDWSELSDLKRAQEWSLLLAQDRGSGFLLSKAPLLRVKLLRYTSEVWRVLVTFHHIILDGWSFHSLLSEVCDNYSTQVSQRDARPRFRDFLAWRQSFKPKGEEAFWESHFQNFEPARILNSEPESKGKFVSKQFFLEQSLTERLKEVCQNNRVTESVFIQAVWARLLAIYCHSLDLAIGVATSGRAPDFPNSESILGPLLNVVPLRFQIDPDIKFSEYLKSVQSRNLDLQEFQLSSLVEIQKWAGFSAEQALFQTLLVFENYPEEKESFQKLGLSGLTFKEQSNFPIAFLVIPGEYLRFQLLVDGSQIHSRLAEDLSQRFLVLLKAILQDPDRPFRDYTCLTLGEQMELEKQGKGIELETTEDVLDSFLKLASSSPELPAITFQDKTWSYGELSQFSDRLASGLSLLGTQPGDRVGLYLKKSPEFVASILALWKLGACYVPLSQDYPKKMLNDIANEAGLRTLVFDQENPEESLSLDIPAVRLSELSASAACSEFPKTRGGEAYLIYTSGSTGDPKGVRVSHQALARSTAARREQYGHSSESFLLLSPLSFDSSVAGLFGTLTSGGCLILPSEEQEQDIFELLSLVEDHSIQSTLCIPSFWNGILDEADPFGLRSLARVIVAGESCPVELVEKHFGLLPNSQLFNEYGPTEGTVWQTVAELKKDGDYEAIPIGQPVAGTILKVQDAFENLCPPGVPGELLISGPSLALGYTSPSNPAESESFSKAGDQRQYLTGDLVYWGENQNLYFQGRLDQQMKVRGHRVEGAAIEAALLSIDGVSQAAVKCFEESFLVAYLVGQVEVETVERELSSHLPSFAIPTSYQFLESLPVTMNGKPDRASLTRPEIDSEGYEEPRNELEEKMAQIWSEVLRVEPVGIHDNFFELGGDSIAALRIAAKARAANIQLNPDFLLNQQSIAKLTL